jgi:uncharacterized small protein (DUF1192 family)
MDIQERLDVICKNSKIDGSETKVTISKDDFLWLVYGVQEQTEKVEIQRLEIERLNTLLSVRKIIRKD